MKKHINRAAFCLGGYLLLSANTLYAKSNFIATKAIIHNNSVVRNENSAPFPTFKQALDWAASEARKVYDRRYIAENLVFLKEGKQQDGKRYWVYGDNAFRPFTQAIESKDAVDLILDGDISACPPIISRGGQQGVRVYFSDDRIAVVNYDYPGYNGIRHLYGNDPNRTCYHHLDGPKEGVVYYLNTVKIYEVDHVETDAEKQAKKDQAKNEELGNTLCNSSSNLHGNPINITTGNKYQAFNLPTGKLKIDASIHYNSQSTISGVFGKNRTSLLDTNVTIEDKQAKVRLPDGKLLHLNKKDNKWSRAGTSQELTQVDNGWQLTNQSSQQVLHFNDQGKLTSITYFDRTLTTIARSGDTITVEDEYGTTAHYTLTNGLAHSVMMASGEPITLSYDAKNNLTDVVFKQDHYQFLFEDERHPHALTKRLKNSKELGRYGYNDKGQAIFSQRGEATEESEDATVVNRRTYEFKNNKTTVTNPLGKKTTYHFEPFPTGNMVEKVEGHRSKNCAATKRQSTYYPNSLVKTQTDWEGNKTSYQYNKRGLEVKRVEADGTKQAKTFYTKWHPQLDLPLTVNQGNVTQAFTYNEHGQLLNKLTRKKISDDQQVTAHDGSVDIELEDIEVPIETGKPDVKPLQSFYIRSWYNFGNWACDTPISINGIPVKNNRILLDEGNHVISMTNNCRCTSINPLSCAVGHNGGGQTINGYIRISGPNNSIELRFMNGQKYFKSNKYGTLSTNWQ